MSHPVPPSRGGSLTSHGRDPLCLFLPLSGFIQHGRFVRSFMFYFVCESLHFTLCGFIPLILPSGISLSPLQREELRLEGFKEPAKATWQVVAGSRVKGTPFYLLRTWGVWVVFLNPKPESVNWNSAIALNRIWRQDLFKKQQENWPSALDKVYCKQ